MMKISSLILVLVLLLTGVSYASEGFKMGDKTAIVITAFGTTYEKTLNSILAIKADAEKAFPETEVRLAFTSNIIRKIWNKRAGDAEYKKEHPSIPAELYNVKNVLGVIGDLQNEGYRSIVVQSTHVANGEEFHDLMSYVRGLQSIRTFKAKFAPFKALALGKPLTGTIEHTEYVDTLAKALADDIKSAKDEGRVLVYMGHGNEHMAQGIYYELEIALNRMYDIPVAIGLVEGQPDLDTVLDKLAIYGNKKVLIKPLMIVAGDHANNDMAGDEDDAWKVILSKAGYDVKPVLEGLGDKPAVRQIFINHMKEAAAEAGITLK